MRGKKCASKNAGGERLSGPKTAIIVGAQWGDEGKGKIVDVLSDHFSVVARYAGGDNGGHAVTIDGRQFIVQRVPCGILRRGSEAVIGIGVVVGPFALVKEVSALLGAGLTMEGPNDAAAKNANTSANLFISNRAEVI